MKLLRVLFATLLGAGILVSAISTGIPEKPKESMALASDASSSTTARLEKTRVQETRASRSTTNIFVLPSALTAASPTTSIPTSTSMTTVPPPPQQKKSTDELVEVASSGGNQNIVSLALAQVDKPYVYGATGPNAFDCSGLVDWVFNQAGTHIPRLTAQGYYAKYQHVSSDDLRPGDLIIFSGHIGIYVGNGQMVHAAEPRNGVRLSSITAPGHPIGYARI